MPQFSEHSTLPVEHALQLLKSDTPSLNESQRRGRLRRYKPPQTNWCRPAGRRELPRKLCFSLLRNNRLRLPSGGANPACWRELYPLESSGFRGARRGRIVSFSYFVVWSSEPKNYREKAAQHAECNY